jgi:hypothetical protein
MHGRLLSWQIINLYHTFSKKINSTLQSSFPEIVVYKPDRFLKQGIFHTQRIASIGVKNDTPKVKKERKIFE